MKTTSDIIEKGKAVIRIEAEAVAGLESHINEHFANAVELILSCTGRVIVTGMGKSGLIARKIVATFNSTGTPSIFLHPSDAIHGDLGMVRNEDVVICVSKSGDTGEINNLLPLLKRIGAPIITMTGNPNSKLANASGISLDVSVPEEACPFDLAPTSSTTAMLVMGDALAIALLEKRGFTKEQFALYHPGGSLGKRLLVKIEELMVSGKAVPLVRKTTSLQETILEITSKRLGATCVVDEEGKLAGIVTDGDLRRFLQKTTDFSNSTAAMAMTSAPKTISKDILAELALKEMEAFSITQLVIVDSEQRPIGMIHLHELVKAGFGEESQ